jgi:hypothetical protein
VPRAGSKKDKGRGRAAGGKSGKGTSSPEAPPKAGLAEVDDDLIYILSHPLRIRMISALNEEDASPKELAERLRVSTYNTAYHMKTLLRYDCVEVVRREKVRGATKTIYRAKMDINFPQRVWQELPPAVQQMVIVAVFMTSFSDAEVALLSRAFELRPESHASWTNANLDEGGWQELIQLVNRTLEEAARIKSEAEDRLAAAPSKQDALRVSLNMSAFVLPAEAEPAADRVTSDAVRDQIEGRTALRHRPGI